MDITIFKKKIIDRLRATGRKNIGSLIKDMNKSYGYFWVWSSSHSHWDGGTAEHCWCVYQFMLYLRDNPDDDLKKYLDETQTPYSDLKKISDDSIAIAGLLHDLGKVDDQSHHGYCSRKKLDELKVGITRIEKSAIRYHHGYDTKRNSVHWKCAHNEGAALCHLLRRADNIAAGTIWNPQLFLGGKTQTDKVISDKSLQRANAINRTNQVIGYHMYCDDSGKFHTLDDFASNNIIVDNDVREVVKDSVYDTVIKEGKGDFFAYASGLADGQQPDDLCIILGGSHSYPGEGAAASRAAVAENDYSLAAGRAGDEKELFICSNMLKSLYVSKRTSSDDKKDTDNNKSRYKYKLSDFGRNMYPLDIRRGSVFYHDVTIIRDGERYGYAYVAPWTVNVVVVAGKHLYGKWNEDIEMLMTDKVKTMFRSAYNNGQRKLVIPAFGADGTWKVPQERMMHVFESVLQDDEFRGAFKEIHFIK